MGFLTRSMDLHSLNDEHPTYCLATPHVCEEAWMLVVRKFADNSRKRWHYASTEAVTDGQLRRLVAETACIIEFVFMISKMCWVNKKAHFVCHHHYLITGISHHQYFHHRDFPPSLLPSPGFVIYLILQSLTVSVESKRNILTLLLFHKCTVNINFILSFGTITKGSCNWMAFISVALCQMTPLKAWVCSHQSFVRLLWYPNLWPWG